MRFIELDYGLETNRLSRIEKHPLCPSSDLEVFSPEEVSLLVRLSLLLDGGLQRSGGCSGVPTFVLRGQLCVWLGAECRQT
jgi:hypothetical protein